MTTYLDIDELAVILGQSARTIRKNLARNASAVPPKMHIPGTKMLRWRLHEVENWLMETAYAKMRTQQVSTNENLIYVTENIELK